MVEDDIIHIKEQIQILHERLENLERVNSDMGGIQLRQLQAQINNIKLVVHYLREKSDE